VKYSKPIRILRVYADTSVFGGFFDEEFSKPTRSFFDQLANGHFQLVTSAVVRDEILAAPPRVREFFLERTKSAEIAEITVATLKLQQAYLDAKILSAKWTADALHVALASVNKCALIVSWNFQHIVHFQKIPQYNAINKLHGFAELGIYSPQEIIEYEDENF
ncbi:MAG: type II toxin-antitoxin system VapC family toxin, partial [Limisphaerales bacterium]